METYTVTTKRTYTKENLEDILDTAFRNTYWCKVIAFAKEAKGEFPSYAEDITNGATLRVKDLETGDQHELNLATILKGLSFMPEFNKEQYDSIDADNLLQYAIFGELVYA